MHVRATYTLATTERNKTHSHTFHKCVDAFVDMYEDANLNFILVASGNFNLHLHIYVYMYTLFLFVKREKKKRQIQ